MKTVMDHPLFQTIIADNPHYHLPSLTDAYQTGKELYYTDLIRLLCENYKGGPISLTAQCTKIRIEKCDGQSVFYTIIEDARLDRPEYLEFYKLNRQDLIGITHPIEIEKFLGLCEATDIFFLRPRMMMPDEQQIG